MRTMPLVSVNANIVEELSLYFDMSNDEVEERLRTGQTVYEGSVVQV